MRIERKAYEWLLLAYPPRFRRRFGREMADLFAAAYAEHRRQGLGPVLMFWARTVRDLALNVPAVWLRLDASLSGPPAPSSVPILLPGSTPPPRWFENLGRDVRYATRQLAHNPVYASIAIITLALGIGANSAIFSVVNGILLRPLPYRDQQDLVVMWSAFPDDPQFPISVAEFLDYRAATQTMQDVAAFGPDLATVSGDGVAEQIQIAYTSANLFAVLGVAPQFGRTFNEEETRPNGPAAAVLSHDYWTTRYGADPGVVGRTTVLDKQPVEIVGILPAGFEPPGRQPKLFLPLQVDRSTITNRSGHWMTGIARLREGTTLERADAELRGILAGWETEFAGIHPNDPQDHPLLLVSLESQLFGAITPTLRVLLGAVGLVLLLACANVANLSLARGEARMRELGIRSALGASRAGLFAQGLVESLVLSGIGGALGLGLAQVGTKLLLALEPGTLPRIDEVTLDGTVVAFTGAITIGTGLLFGLVPTIRGARTDVASSLRAGGRGRSASRDARRTLSALAAAQMGLAVVLLVGAGLLIKSFYRLQQVDPGFDPAHRIGFNVRLLPADYPTREDAIRFQEEVLTRLGAAPGVDATAAARGLPMRNSLGVENFEIDGYEPPSPEQAPSAYYHSASPGYFRTMGIAVARGREFTEADRIDGTPVAIVNETFAARYLGTGNPVGRRLRGLFAGPQGRVRQIVGVVGDVHHDGPATTPRAVVYLPMAQTPDGWAVLILRTPGFVVRSSLDQESLTRMVRETVNAVDPNVPVTNIAPLEAAVRNATAGRRFLMMLVGTFAAVALGIAAVGVYGVMSFAVVRRRQEIGIRLALGAAPGRVLREIIGRGLKLAVVGGTIGLALALGGAQVMRSLVFGIGVRDVSVFLASIGVLGLVAVSASTIPAWRASGTSPSRTLRVDG